jgi:4-amino-4-deoxy-L-arabinose transferase-like glycosyltransferase
LRWDEPDYLILGRNLLRGAGYQIYGTPDLMWPPGTPLMAAASLGVGISVDYALVVWHVLAGAAACAILFGLARDVTGNALVAALAGLLAAVAPALAVWPLYWGSMTEPLFLAFWLAGLWATWRAMRDGSWLAAGIAGCAFGASYLVRTEGIFWWALFLLPVSVIAFRRRQRWLVPALFVAGFLVLALPYVAYLFNHTGRLMISGKTGIVVFLSPYFVELGGLGHDMLTSLDSTGREIMWLSPEQFDISFLDTVVGDPAGFLRQVRANLVLAQDGLLDVLVGFLIVGLALLGLFARPWNRRRLAGEAFWFAAIIPLAILFISKVETRYLVPLVPIIFVWTAYGFVGMGSWLAGTVDQVRQPGKSAPQASLPDRGRAVSAVAIALLIVAAGLSVRLQLGTARVEQAKLPLSHKEAGLWLAQNSQEGEAVMTRDRELALYADRPLIALPRGDWATVLDYGQARGADYLVIDDWEIRELRPELSFLLDPSQAPAEAEYLRTFVDPRRTTYVYRLRG